MRCAVDDSLDQYRREARRLRARLQHQPRRLYAALQALALRHDTRAQACAQIAQRLSHQGWNDPHLTVPRRALDVDVCSNQTERRDHDAAFLELVRGRVNGPVLRFSVRRKLLGHARKLGIGRFHANLLIAMVLHERRHIVEVEDDGRTGILLPLLVAVTLQAMAMAGLWWSLS